MKWLLGKAVHSQTAKVTRHKRALSKDVVNRQINGFLPYTETRAFTCFRNDHFYSLNLFSISI